MVHTIRVVLSAAAALCSAAVIPFPSNAQEQAEEPHLIFKKTVKVIEYDEGRAYTAPHTIRKGDHLWKILREYYKMPDSDIAFYCKIAKAVNPAIKNIDTLYPEQDILVPYKYIKGMQDNETGSVPQHDVEHVFREGEHFGMVLRDRYHLPDHIIFSRNTAALIREANPDIVSLDSIEDGQKVVIPAAVFNRAGYAVPEKPQSEQSRPAAAASAEPEAVSEKAPPQTPDRPEKAAEPEADGGEKKMQTMMSNLVRSFKGTDNSSGMHEFPVDESSTIKLDYSSFPVYEFPWGKKVLFDYGERMPAVVKDVIASEWENAEIVAVSEKDDMEGILDRVLDSCGFFKVEKEGAYIANRDNIQLSVSGDWIVFKDAMMKNVFIINLVKDDRPSYNPALQTYIQDMGLQIVDIHERHGGAPQASPAAAVTGPPAKSRSVEKEPFMMTDFLLDTVGIQYHRNYSTEIFQNMTGGLSLEVLADRMFVKDGAAHLIDFHSLPRKIVHIIKQQGFNLLQLKPDDEITEVITRVLDFCRVEYTPPPVAITTSGAGHSNIKLTVPGFLVPGKQENVLLTDLELNENIVSFLAEEHVTIVKY